MNYMFSSGLADPDFSHRFPPCWSDTSRFDSIETDQLRNKMTTTVLLNYHLPPQKIISIFSRPSSSNRLSYHWSQFPAVSPDSMG